MGWFIGFARLETPLVQCEQSKPNFDFYFTTRAYCDDFESDTYATFTRNKSRSSDTLTSH